MSISIIHLSDLHLKEGDLYITERAKSIVNAVQSNIDLDAVLLITSGDIAFSGKPTQYALAKNFFDTLISTLPKQGKQLSFFAVPGNHDIDFNDQPRHRAEILKIRRDGYPQSFLDNEIKKSSGFWDFIKSYDPNLYADSKFVDVCDFVLNNQPIHLSLINTAAFSLYKDENADSDCDLHYIPTADLGRLKRNPAALNICLMHHGLDCFCEETKSQLYTILNQEMDMIFTGHNHFIRIEQTRSSKLNTTLSFQGGKLNDSSKIESSFSTITYDPLTNEVKTQRFCWNPAQLIYEVTSSNTSILYKYEFSRDFKSWLSSSGASMMPVPYNNYFVFPRLKISKENDFNSYQEKEILSLVDFNKMVENKNIIEIFGEDLSGKTTLLKFLYENYESRYLPFLITNDDITVSIDKTIKNAFEKQFGEDNASYQKFLQLPANSKIVFIDDIDLIKDKGRKALLEKLWENFDKIIYTTSQTYELDINKLIINTLEKDDKTMIRLKIEPFYADKRNDLILKVCNCLTSQQDSDNINDVATQVNTFIKNQIKLFSLNPAFIIMFTHCFISNYVDRSNNNAFNEVFSSNISAAIEKARKKTSLQDDLAILQEVANFAHFRKQYPIKLTSFCEIVENFNKEHRAKCNSIDVINELTAAKILKQGEHGISFVNKSYLAFFVAKWLNRQIHNGAGQTELKFVVDNICFNINADILLFLTFITENVGALYVILNEAKLFSENIEEYDYDNKPMSVLTDWARPQGLSLITERRKKQIKNNEIAHERHIKEQEKLEKVNIYEEDIGDIVAIQTKLLKYLEIIAKILPNFSHLLDAEQQDEFVEEIYILPNKVITALFQPFEQNQEELLAELKEQIKERHLQDKYRSIDDIKCHVSDLLNAMMLTLYDITAQNAVTERTIDALDAFNYKRKTTHFIQNIMMHEQLKGFAQYVERSDALFDETKSLYIKHLLRLVFRKHCLYNDIKYIGGGQKYLDKYLPQSGNINTKLIAHRLKKKNKKK